MLLLLLQLLLLLYFGVSIKNACFQVFHMEFIVSSNICIIASMVWFATPAILKGFYCCGGNCLQTANGVCMSASVCLSGRFFCVLPCLCLPGCLVAWLVCLLAACLAGWLGLLARLLACLLAGCLAAWLGAWLVGLLLGCLAGRLLASIAASLCIFLNDSGSVCLGCLCAYAWATNLAMEI